MYPSDKANQDTEYITRVLENLEFDGTQVLCRVCGDKASGFHYGVHSCEGCKGFFRRSIQQKIQYRPCTKNQQCAIQRVNRNRCQYCRLKKCISVGMSRDAVRFGRVPKREKARIIAAMQSVQSRTLERSLLCELDDEAMTVRTILQAYVDTCDFTTDNIKQLRNQAAGQPLYTPDLQATSCPLFPTSESSNQSTFSVRFSKAIRGIINFALRIPGFTQIPTEDRFLLLKSGAFEALLVSLASLYDSESNTFLCMNGRLMRRDSIYGPTNSRFLMDSVCDYAERMNRVALSDVELAMFTAIVIIAPDRHGIRNRDLIERLNGKLSTFLQNLLHRNHPEHSNIYRELMSFIPDLRTLNTLHSDKSFCQKKMEQYSNGNTSTFLDESRYNYEDKDQNSLSPTSSYSPEDNRSPTSYHDSMNGDSGSPDGSVSSNEASSYMEATSYTRGDQKTFAGAYSRAEQTETLGKCPYTKRKTESSDDSGVESDKVSLPSMCSSPRSSIDEKIEEEREEDMPVLRRALQAPPIMNTDLIMEEAYKPHKKFRAFRKDEEQPHSSVPGNPRTSILAQTLFQPPQSTSLLASALASPTLSRTLLDHGSKSSEDYLKRADILHSLIIKNETHKGTRSQYRSEASPTPYYAPVSVMERLQPPTSSAWSGRDLIYRKSDSPSRETLSSQPRYHLLTSPSPSRFFDSKDSRKYHSSPSHSPKRGASSPLSFDNNYSSQRSQTSVELHLDISDSQPLNLSKKDSSPSPDLRIEV